MCSPDIFLGLLAMLFPPLPVWVKRGICSADSLINILLCILGYLPGLIHAWYIIAKYPEQSYDYEVVPGQDSERATGYVFVHDGRRVQGQQVGGTNQQPRPQPPPKPSQNQPANYGTTSTTTSNNTNVKSAAGPATGPVVNGNGEGSSDVNPPPSYAQVVASGGDHKVQTQD